MTIPKSYGQVFVLPFRSPENPTSTTVSKGRKGLIWVQKLPGLGLGALAACLLRRLRRRPDPGSSTPTRADLPRSPGRIPSALLCKLMQSTLEGGQAGGQLESKRGCTKCELLFPEPEKPILNPENCLILPKCSTKTCPRLRYTASHPLRRFQEARSEIFGRSGGGHVRRKRTLKLAFLLESRAT
jgi:hypothetical protein